MLRKGFTLAEVLIALLLVGILSSISIQTLRNRDNSAEYEALRNKAVTNIQGVMHESLYSTMSSEIFDKNFTEVWDKVNKRLSTGTGSIKSKDGAINITTSQVMRDGVNYAYTQKEGNSHVAEITIDVNGSKAPNEEGKDIFKYNMDKFGGILLATIPDEPDKEYCPDGVTVKNSDGSNCPKCTDGSMVTTPDRSNCPKCPNGTTERNADGSNCDKCANGEMANANRSNCPKCANGQEANATRSNCPLCPDGTTEKINAAGSNCPSLCTGDLVKSGDDCQCPTDKPYRCQDHCCPDGKLWVIYNGIGQCSNMKWSVDEDGTISGPGTVEFPCGIDLLEEEEVTVTLSLDSNETGSEMSCSLGGESQTLIYPASSVTIKVKKGSSATCRADYSGDTSSIHVFPGRVYHGGASFGAKATFTINEDTSIHGIVIFPKN